MAIDTPRITDSADLPQTSGYRRARTILIAVASATNALGLRHRLIEPTGDAPELRVWNPARNGATMVVRDGTEAEPDRRGGGLALLVRVDSGETAGWWAQRNSMPFLRLEDDDPTSAAQQIARMLEQR